MILAVDTATSQAGIALATPTELRAELIWQAGRHHTERFAPMIMELCKLADAPLAGLSAVAVGLGPGSFTGLRIGLALAKGLAAAQGIPIIGIPSLQAAAWPHLEGETPICALLPVGRGRLAAQSFDPTGAWEGGALRFGTLAEVTAGLTQPTRFVGEITMEQRTALSELHGPLAILVASSLGARRPSALATLAWARLHRGETDNLEHLAPIYAHASGIE